MVRSLAWTGAVRWPTQLLTWVCTLVVARILSPADYGLVGMATIYLGLVTLVNEFGLGSAIVTFRDLSDEHVAQLNTISLGLGVICFLFSTAAAVPLGRFFSAPHLPAVVVAMSVSFLVSAFLTVPDAVLQKNLRFKFLAQIEVVRSLVQSSGILILALLGAGYWALVFGPLLGVSTGTLLTVIACHRGFRIPRFSALKPAVSYSSDVLFTRLAWYGYSNADFLVAGKVLGANLLGAYTMAWTIANIPVDKITALVGRVAHAYFSAVQDQNVGMQRYLLSLTEGIALFTFPASVGLCLEAGHLVSILLGPKWQGAIVPLRLLSIYVSVRSISTLLPTVLNVRRHSRFVMWNTILAVIFFPIAFYVGSRWGTTGIAAAWIACYPFNIVPLYWKVFRTINLSLSSYLASLWPACSGSVAILMAVGGLQALAPADWPLALRAAMEIAAGITAYASVFLIFHRKRLRTFLNIVKNARKPECSSAVAS